MQKAQKKVLISRALRLADLIDLLYGYENRDPSSTPYGPLLLRNRPDKPYMGVHNLNRDFFKRHFSDDFVKELEDKAFLTFKAGGRISSTEMKSDLMGTRNTSSNAGGSGVKKAFLALVEKEGYDGYGRSKVIKKIYEANRETLATFRQEDLTSLREGLCRYIDGIPEAEDNLKLPASASLRCGAVKENLKDFLKFCKEPLETPPETDEENLDVCAESLAWLMVGAFLRRKINDSNLVRFYKPDHEELHFSRREQALAGPGASAADPAKELYARLMARLRDTRKWHPSIRMMTPDPVLFPKGLPSISNAERTAAKEKEKPISIRDMVMKSWEEHKHLLLVGEGGIGKTVCMLTLPDEKWIRELQIPAVYVPLQGLDIYEGNLSSYIKENAEESLELAGDPWESHPQLLLLLDGFNEIPMQYRKVAEMHIRAWMDKPGVQVITTSRISFSLAGRFLEYKLEPLPKETVWAFLLRSGLSEADLPGDTDPLWKVVNVPLMLALFVQTDMAREMSENSDVSAILNWKEPDNTAHIIWDYLQTELFRLLSIDSSALPAAAILAVAPFVCFEMAKNGKFYLKQEEFKDILRKAVQFFSRNPALVPGQVSDAGDYYDTAKEWLFDERRWESYFNLLSKQSALFQREVALKETATDSGRKLRVIYAPVHQNFRDALAAMFISGCMMSSVQEKLPFPGDKLEASDLYVKNYISEFLKDSELEKVWDHHRSSEPENGRVTWILMDIIGRKRDYDYRELDFSGLDLSGINLHRHLSRRPDICPLPDDADLFTDAHLVFNCFIPEGHSDAVINVAFSPDGNLLASASYDNTVRVWDLLDGSCRVLGRCAESVTFSPDGKLLASASDDNTVRIWDLQDGSCRVLKGHSGPVHSVAFSPDGRLLVSASDDNTVRVWDLPGGSCRVLKGHSGWVMSVVFSPDGRLLASVSHDKTVRVWDLQDSSCRVLKGHSRLVHSVAFSPDSRLLVSASADKTVRVWDLQDSSCRVLEGHSGSVYCVAVSPDGRLLASGSDDTMVRVWDLPGDSCRVLKGHSGWDYNVAFSPDARLLVSASHDNTVRVWSLQDGSCHVLEGHSGSVYCVAVSPDGRLLASASDDNTVRVWDLPGGSCRVLKGHSSSVNSAAFSPDGKLLASASDDNTVRVWDLPGGSCRVLKGHSDSVKSVAFSPDGRFLVSASHDKTVQVRDLLDGSCRALVGHSDSVNSVAFSPDGRLLVSASNDDTVRVWNLMNVSHRVLEGHSRRTRNITPHTDSRLLASASWDNTVRVWDLPGGSCRVLEGHSDSVESVAFSPDGRFLVASHASYWNNSVQVWDLLDGSCRVLEGHSQWVKRVAFSPDGRLLASASDDNTVRVWNLLDGSCRVLEGHSRWVHSVAFSPDSRLLASASYDNTVRVWDLLDGSCRVLERCAERVTFSPNGKLLASYIQDDTVQVWDLLDGSCRVLNGHSRSFNRVAFSPDGGLLASTSWDNTVQVWDLLDGSCRILGRHSDSVGSVAFSPDGRLLASVSKDNKIRMWDLGCGSFRDLEGHSDTVNSIAFSPDGRYFASGSEDTMVRVWDLGCDNLGDGICRVLYRHSTPGVNVAFSPDRRFLAVAFRDLTSQVWDLETECIIKRFRIIPHINLSGANFEKALIPEKDKEMLKDTGAKI